MSFMIKVAKHIIEAYLIHRKLVDVEQHDKQASNSKVHFLPLQVQTRNDSSNPICKMQLHGSIGRYATFASKRKASKHVWEFVNSLEYSKCSHQYNATTWLELYLLYRCKGYPKPIEDRKCKARAKATVQMQLREFKNTCRGVLQRGVQDEEVHNLFRPCKITHERFLNLGLRGKHPAIEASIIFDEEAREVVQKNLITLGHRIPNKKIQEFIEGKIYLKPNVPNLKGRAGWDSNLAIMPQRDSTVVQHEPTPIANGECKQASNTCFMCPHCNHPQVSNTAAFQLQDLDKVHKCKNCKRTSKVQAWLCMCHLRWHSCIKHQAYANCATSKTTPCSTAKPVKRPLGPLTLAELQEIDAKRIRINPPRILPPAPNLLSIKLRERFAHLFPE